jgi:hypothetical protein
MVVGEYPTTISPFYEKIGMKVIDKTRQSGKTTELIKMCHSRHGYIVCSSRDEALRIHKVSRDLGYKIPLPITYDEFIQKRYYAYGGNVIYIDNVEMLLRAMTPCEIGAITVNVSGEQNGGSK